MGTSFASQLLSTDVEPEEKLWRGVLVNAIERRWIKVPGPKAFNI